MGRHYPNIDAEPVRTAGYYYSGKYRKLARLQLGEKLPRHMAPWEFLARDGEGTSSEVLGRLRELHPELDPFRLSFTTTTPVDPPHLMGLRVRKLAGYLLVGLAAVTAGWLLGGARLRGRRGSC